MKELHELKEKLMDELKEQAREIGKKGRMSAGDLDNIAKLTKSIDRLCDIVEQDGYSQAGRWHAEGDYGHSYANRGQHYVRGHYSRDGYSQDGYSQDYSRSGDHISKMEDMMRNARNSEEREAIRRCIEVMKG